MGIPNTNVTTQDDTISSDYARNGKIMLSCVVILFALLILTLSFHSYIKWFFRRRNRRRRVRAALSSPSAVTPAALSSKGLDRSVVQQIPVFVFTLVEFPNNQLDCAVCLSEFEENEEGRVLPECNHTFHVDCIDTWFQTRSSCPLCRAPVSLSGGKSVENGSCLCETTGSGPIGSCMRCQRNGDVETGFPSSSTSSSSSPEAIEVLVQVEVPVPVEVEVPKEFDDIGLGSGGRTDFMVSGQGVASLKRILTV